MVLAENKQFEFKINNLNELEENLIEIKNLNVKFGENHVLKNVTMPIKRNRITAIIGPSGCGKSTLLRTINRLAELDNATITGEILYNGFNILRPDTDINLLRKKIGMVFQTPNPFPQSIYSNLTYGPKIHGIRQIKTLNNIVKDVLTKAALWNEVKDRLGCNALSLSGGQQQRLCIARSLSVNPELLLLDEPCSALDPISTAKIEDLLLELSNLLTIVIVTHNIQQATRISDYTAFMYLGELIEYGPTNELFINPKDKRTRDYISGVFG
ncbi:MAG: phosphate ABC transporter ATP-binding protein PstB [Candidatus Odinarchaeum yellowstonii]|uniref:Phosphate ABC transporter ATP-binding protein PstB n=1 Tax=Odinarchaeota yellowstonii (strain LCB_4) TaxID=1841599 RepID=A0AAF0D2U7_ODILC|nr:MAG: phosphate ABC transporter ATP-binding protein PstB [Candidatus Odinarchaeum yellowstonii]